MKPSSPFPILLTLDISCMVTLYSPLYFV